MAISVNSFIEENVDSDDSEANSDVEDNTPDYYQPISAMDDDDDDTDSSDQDEHLPNETTEIDQTHLSNGHVVQIEGEGEEEDEGVEDLEAATATATALREDSNRRNVPLPPENASRIMDAMRQISFPGFTPDWAQRVPEELWIDQLRRLRVQPSSPSTQN